MFTSGYWETNSIDEHIWVLKQQTIKSTRDPALILLCHEIKKATATQGGTAVFRYKDRAWNVPLSLDSDPEIRRLRVVSSPFERRLIGNVWNFVVTAVTYVDDPDDADQFAVAAYTLTVGVGDCDDFTILFAAMFKILGAQVRARVVSTDGVYWSHVYPMVKVKSAHDFIALDATVRNAFPGWEFPSSREVVDFNL